MCNSLNLFVFMLWLKYFKFFSYDVNIDFMPETIINGALSYIIKFASPFILLNYFLIFRKDRYKMLIEKYSQKKGKFPLTYCLSSIFTGFLSLLLYSLLTR